MTCYFSGLCLKLQLLNPKALSKNHSVNIDICLEIGVTSQKTVYICKVSWAHHCHNSCCFKMKESHSLLNHTCCYICYNPWFIERYVHLVVLWESGCLQELVCIQWNKQIKIFICLSISQNLTKWDMFDPISKYLISCYFMRYLVGSLAFYLLVVALYQYCNGGWEDIKNIFWGISQSC